MSDFRSSLTDKWLSSICNDASIISEIASTLKPFLGDCGLYSCFLNIFLEFQVRFLCIRIFYSELFIYKMNRSYPHCILPICCVEDTLIYTHKDWCFQVLKHLNYYMWLRRHEHLWTQLSQKVCSPSHKSLQRFAENYIHIFTLLLSFHSWFRHQHVSFPQPFAGYRSEDTAYFDLFLQFFNFLKPLG